MNKLLIILLLLSTSVFAGSKSIEERVDEYNVGACEEALDYFQQAHDANPDDEYFTFMLQKWEDRCL